MYINIEVFKKSGLQPNDILFLCAIKQCEEQFLIDYLTEDDYKRFEQLSLITHIKTSKKGEHLYKSLRLTQKGRDLMSELEEPVQIEEDYIVWLWLSEHYKILGKEVGNGKRTQKHIRDFRVKSGIQKNNLITLCLDFIEDEDNMKFNQNLEFAFFKGMNAFQTRFNLEDSRLYKHYLKKEQYFKSIFKEY